MNKVFKINGCYYVIAMDYYDAITKYQKYKNEYDERIIHKIEFVSDDVVDNTVIKIKESEIDDDYYDDYDDYDDEDDD